MTRATMTMMTAIALGLVACGSREQAAADADAAPAVAGESMPAPVALAAAVARGIEANPAAADSILSANGLTAAGLDSLMYTIAEDSALSAAYTRALR